MEVTLSMLSNVTPTGNPTSSHNTTKFPFQVSQHAATEADHMNNVILACFVAFILVLILLVVIIVTPLVRHKGSYKPQNEDTVEEPETFTMQEPDNEFSEL